MGPSVNSLCRSGTFCQHPSTFRLSTWPSVNFLWCSRTFCKLPSTLCASVGPSINCPCVLGTFRQHFVLPSNLPLFQSTFLASVWPSVNFLCCCGTFRQNSLWLEHHSSTFIASMGHSINFRELSVRPRDFTSVLHAYVNFRHLPYVPKNCANYSCVCGTFSELPSIFRWSAVTSIKF